MAKFILLNRADHQVAIRADRIVAVFDNGEDTSVLTVGNERPYYVDEAVVDVVAKIQEAVVPAGVVRCKECVHRHIRPQCQGRSMDWFCPLGERRGDV